MNLNIIQTLHDDRLFKPFLQDQQDNLKSWKPWFAALRVLYGLGKHGPRSQRLIKECTGRDPELLPGDGFNTALFLTGRRSGKSRITSIVACFEALLGGHEHNLAAGEQGKLLVISPTKAQS